MSVVSGDKAPTFALPGTDNTPEGRRTYTLEEYRGQPVVLVFYPGDNTPVCTRQLNTYTEEITEFDDSAPVPYGYTRVTRTRKGLIIGGAGAGPDPDGYGGGGAWSSPPATPGARLHARAIIASACARNGGCGVMRLKRPPATTVSSSRPAGRGDRRPGAAVHHRFTVSRWSRR